MTDDEDDAFFTASQMMAVKAPTPMAPLCGACKLNLSGCLSPKMPRDGRGEQRVLIIAEAPGKDEDIRGKPLVGETGQLLERVLAGLNVNMRRDCWLYNAVICRPPDNKLANHKKAIEYCRPNVLRTIRELKPEVIILLGTVAVQSLITHLWKKEPGGIMRWAGWRIPSIELNAWVCPTFHPSFVSREKSPVVNALFREHLRQAFFAPGRPWGDSAPDYESQVEVILSPADAAARLRKYRTGLIAFDFESVTLKPDHPDAELVCCSVCWEGQETIAFPWHGSVKSAMMGLLENPVIGKIASNSKHEDRWTRRKMGLTIPRNSWRWDVMLTAHSLDIRKGITGLKFQAFVRLGAPNYSSHIEPFLSPKKAKGGNATNRVKEIEPRQLFKYCGVDSLLEFGVAEHQAKEMGVSL